jgi:hypothetical protein
MFESRVASDREAPGAVARPAVASKETYAAIEQLMREDRGISRQEAFRRYADASGKQLGAVSANYYREARKQRQARPKAMSSPSSRANVASMDEFDALAKQLAESALRLAELVAQQHRELAEERERIDRAKQAIRDA